MMATYPQHPNQLQQHPGQQGPQQQHIQGHPGQPNAMVMQPMHPQQQAVYQQQMAARAGGNIHPAIQQQALLVRQRQQQQLMNGMSVGNPGMAFQNPNGAPQVRAGGLPNGMYAGSGPGGIPGGNLGAFAQNPQLRGMFPPQMQQQLQQQQQQQQHIAAAQQFTMANQAAAQNNAQASMGMPQQGPQIPLNIQHVHQIAAQRAAAAAVTQQKTLGLSVLRLHQFADHLAMFNPATQNNDINHWRKFVSDFYSPIGVMRQQLVNTQKNEMKQFEITTNLLARYYFTLFESGIQNVQMLLELPREKPTANQGMTVECQKMSFIYWFDNGCHLVAQGELRVHFNQGQMIDMLDFSTRNHTEYVTRATMNNLLNQESPELIKMSPGGKNLGKRVQQRIQSVQGPVENVTCPYGIPSMVLQLLENAETFSQMKDLITFSHQNSQLGPTQALAALVSQQQQQQQHALAQQQAAQHQAAQGMNGPVPRSIVPGGPGAAIPNGPQQPGIQMTNSPSANDIQMRGVMSPHVGGAGATPSPAQNHMQAPGMVAQHSQHQHPTSNPSSQTSTTVGSANTSPNQTNKRRRASTTNVKTEGEDSHLVDSGAANGVAVQKMKQSPRVNANKRTKLST